MTSVSCPTCGSTVSFSTEFSTHAVCSSCDSLLVRTGAKVDLIGKVAELQPDGSPLKVGTHGLHKNIGFQIVGRIQVSFGDGYWNEWYLLYSNGETGWLGEAMGEYFVNAVVKTSGKLPAAGKLKAGDRLALAGEDYVATSITENTVVSFEGELPFIADTKTPFLTVDLRTTSSHAATLDYSEEVPLLFMGEYLPFGVFKFTNLKVAGEGADDGPLASAQAEGVQKLSCPNCGAAHTIAGGVRSKVLVCEYCGSAIDIGNPGLEILWREESMRKKLQTGVTLKLGSIGRIEGEKFKLLGFIKKSVRYEGIVYPWVEYLFYHEFLGYRWLVESDGHFVLMSPMAAVPEQDDRPAGRPSEGNLRYEGRAYQHFQTSKPKVDAVAGEFYWRIRIDEESTNYDFVCPPYTLSLESSSTGFVWSHGIYLNEEEASAAFEASSGWPTPSGIAPSQPNPYKETTQANTRVLLGMMLLSLFLMVAGPFLGRNKNVWDTGSQTYMTNRASTPNESLPFQVSGSGNLSFDFQASLRDRWLFIDSELVDDATKKTVARAGRTLQRYGSDNASKSSVRLAGIPNGTYRLRWKLLSGTKTAVPDRVDDKARSENISYKISLRRGVPVWGWWWLFVIALVPWPLYIASKSSGFETQRWYNSDHG